MKQYLVHFASKNYEFRVPELYSIAQCLGINFKFDNPNISVEDHINSPFHKIWLDNDEAAARLCSRSVSIFGIFEIWGEGNDYGHLKSSMESYIEKEGSALDRYINERTFKFEIHAYGRKYSYQEQVELMKNFAWLNWKSKISLRNPEEIYYIFEVVGLASAKDVKPSYIYFCRQVSTAQRSLIDKFTLKKRSYLGTTSMEAEISFFSANQALARPGAFILDPFVGTGSLLLTCAEFGSYTIGADIDMDVLTGNTGVSKEGTSIHTNFAQYNLTDKLVGLIRFDHSSNNVFRTNPPFLDAIVCDPPYGIRAGAKKVGIRHGTATKHAARGTNPVPIHTNPNDPKWLPHTPQCVPYSVPDVLADLLDFSAKALIMGGRLVYWLPTTCDYTDKDLPLHPCFNIIANSEQKLTSIFSRRLITMEKIREYDPALVAFIPEQKSFEEALYEPAHSNLAAKITKDPKRHDDRNENKDAAFDVTEYKKRPTGSEIRKAKKAERKARRKAEEASKSESSQTSETSQASETSGSTAQVEK